MKKIAYQIPSVKIQSLFMDQLMTGSIGAQGGGTDDIGYGNEVDDGSHEVDAKNFGHRSVWDD